MFSVKKKIILLIINLRHKSLKSYSFWIHQTSFTCRTKPTCVFLNHADCQLLLLLYLSILSEIVLHEFTLRTSHWVKTIHNYGRLSSLGILFCVFIYKQCLIVLSLPLRFCVEKVDIYLEISWLNMQYLSDI